jgi:hypothetical protein
MAADSIHFRMERIRSPATPIDHPDRFLACQEAIELALREVA